MTINTYIFSTVGILCTIAVIRKLELYFKTQNNEAIEDVGPDKKDASQKQKLGVFQLALFPAKEWLGYRGKLIRVFYLKFFAIRELVYVEFTYEYFKHHTMKRETFTRLAYVSRVTPIERLNKLFNHKVDGVKLKLVSAKIIPLANIPKA